MKKPKDMMTTGFMMGQLAPLPVKPITPGRGLIPGFFENWKLEQVAKSTALIRQIAENQNATASSYSSEMQTMFNHNARVKAEQDMLSAQVEIVRAEAQEKKLKNMQLQLEAMKMEFEYKQMVKDNE